MALLSLQNITLRYGSGATERPLLDGVNLQIERGERVCLLGRNGVGKSTLLRLLSGEIAPAGGTVAAQKGARVARLSQEVPQDVSGTVFDVVAGGWMNGAMESSLADGETAPAHQVEAIVSRLRLQADAPFATLSGGLKRRAWLGRALVGDPDILLLDEPTNHLDIDSIAWLEEFLLRHVKTLLFVTHDRMFLRRLATRIVEIDRASLYSWECDYDTYLERKEAALESEAKGQALFDNRLAQEEAWVRRGVEARRTKSQSRIRALIAMREERLSRREKPGMARLLLQDAGRSGHLVVEAENVSFSYDSQSATQQPVIHNFSTLIMRGDKVGIIGPNGSGKTTLLELLLDGLEPQRGTVRRGTRLQVAYFDQLRDQIDDDLTVQQNVCGENSTVTFNGEARHIVGYLQEFLFSPDRARTPAGVLSGGERNRLLLAKLFTQPANVLVMDEPTNDLDAETLELLENLLVEFKGTLLLVSHDRAFLNNVVTSTLAFETDASGQTVINDYAGGYDDWLRQRPAPPLVATSKSSSQATTANGSLPKGSSKPAPSVSRPRKLSFKEQRELESLPVRIETLEAEQQALTEKMAEPAFYQADSDGSATVQAMKRLAEMESELATAYARWEELLEVEKLALAAQAVAK